MQEEELCNKKLSSDCVCVCVCVSQVFDFLIRLHSADSSEEEEVFPFIRTLLHFDTREFLNVLAMVRFPLAVLSHRVRL